MSAEAIGPANTSVPVSTTEPVGAHAPNRKVARTHSTDASQEAPATQKEIRQSVELMSKAIARLNHGVRFEIDESTKTIITKVIDKNTNEIIRQMPSQEVLTILQRLRLDKGVLLDIEA